MVGALLLVFVGAVSFYLYSRIIFNERKMGLIESLLLDIKMTIDMEETHAPKVPEMPAVTPGPIELEEVEEYQNVLEEAQQDVAAEPTTTMPPAAPANSSESSKNYDDYSRDELAFMAEKRGVRVTKRMAKGTIIALLQESDKAASQQGDDVAGAATTLPAVEGSSGGAPLDAVPLEEMA